MKLLELLKQYSQTLDETPLLKKQGVTVLEYQVAFMVSIVPLVLTLLR